MHLGRGGISCFGFSFFVIFLGCFIAFYLGVGRDKEIHREIRQRRFVKICRVFLPRIRQVVIAVI